MGQTGWAAVDDEHTLDDPNVPAIQDCDASTTALTRTSHSTSDTRHAAARPRPGMKGVVVYVVW